MELFKQSLQFSGAQAVAKIGEFLPAILSAIILVILGLILAPIVGGLAAKIINFLKIDKIARDAGIKEVLGSFGDVSVAKLIGKLVKWFVIVVFLIMAADSLGLAQLNLLLAEIVLYIPQVIVAVVILTAGLLGGSFVGTFVEKATHDTGHASLLAKSAKISVIVFAIVASLVELGIAPELLQILFTGIVVALALAFGLGGRKKAEETLERLF
jgi:hypothetical protein